MKKYQYPDRVIGAHEVPISPPAPVPGVGGAPVRSLGARDPWELLLHDLDLEIIGARARFEVTPWWRIFRKTEFGWRLATLLEARGFVLSHRPVRDRGKSRGPEDSDV